MNALLNSQGRVGMVVLCAAVVAAALSSCNIEGAGNFTQASQSGLELAGFPPTAIRTGLVLPDGSDTLGFLRIGERARVRVVGPGADDVVNVTIRCDRRVLAVESPHVREHILQGIGLGQTRIDAEAVFPDGSHTAPFPVVAASPFPNSAVPVWWISVVEE